MKKKLLIMGGALACLAGVGGIMAYFTDTDDEVNKFTIGEIEIDLQEPNWPTDDEDGDEVPDEHEDVLPNETIAKDPKILNTGVNDSYMFLEVKVPAANVVVANPDGTKNTRAMTELFAFKHYAGEGEQRALADGINPAWVQVSKSDVVDGYVTYVFAYGAADAMTVVAKDAETATLFDAVTFANIIEGQNYEGTNLTINVKAYGIQTTNINGGKTAPADVWTVVNNQVNG
jgi:predicted ribosomally synthesized peptide with SipW-like signal peptide